MTAVQARGFGLVEALVTVLIIAIGYLALARLHAALWRSASAMENVLSAYSLSIHMNERETVAGEGLPPPVLHSSTTEFHPEISKKADGNTLIQVYSVHWKESTDSRSIRLEPVRLLDSISDLRYLPAAEVPVSTTGTAPPSN